MMDENTLRRLQLTQLEILKIFDDFCRKNGLKYSLYAGTLLGAVRHKAFIPWDDDLDVCMERKEYDRFISLWEKSHPEEYILQNKENTPKFWQSFSKIRKDHTTFLQEEKERGKYHTGIFIDIFPLDRIPNGKLSRAVFRWHCMKYQLMTREFVPPKAGKIVKLGSRIILGGTPKKIREKVRNRELEKITRNNEDNSLEIAAIETMQSLRSTFSKNMFDSYIDLPFEDGKFMCFSDWDGHLKQKFGDYMLFPPEKDRVWKHHPIIIDFERNYEELNIQK